jgi:hypothetical protein
MPFTIIEDCSPYYIRFIHEDFEKISTRCLQFVKEKKFYSKFTNYRYPIDQANQILNDTTIKNLFDINIEKVALFVTKPGLYYRAHKDGPNHRFGINYGIKILDEDCITSWYSNEELKDYPIDYLGGRSREASGFIKENHKPLKSIIAKQGEIILFNTEIFHDFDNSKSSNERMILKLRVNNPDKMYFEDAKKILFSDRK